MRIPLMAHLVLQAGDPAPRFVQACTVPGERYAIDSAAGRFILLCFFPSFISGAGRAALDLIERNRALFDDGSLAFFGVSADPVDERSGRLRAAHPGIRFFFDGDGSASRAFGALQDDGDGTHRPIWFLLDPMLRIKAALPFSADDPAEDRLVPLLRGLPPLSVYGARRPVPVLVLDDIFEPGFRETLIRYQAETGSYRSGIFAQREGRSQAMLEPGFKRRRDCMVKDPELVQQIQARIIRRVVPDLYRATNFQATRLERLLVACYDSRERGGFGPHRDNVVPAVAHRRFACSINLNDDYDGGGIQFPEFGRALFRPPAGSAILFSCSLLHEVIPVTRGQRFALLPFLFDEAAAAVKQANAEAIRHGNEEAARIAR